MDAEQENSEGVGNRLSPQKRNGEAARMQVRPETGVTRVRHRLADGVPSPLGTHNPYHHPRDEVLERLQRVSL